MSSPNYHHLAHLKIPLKDILFATYNFAEQHRVGTGGFGNYYWGWIDWSGESIYIYAQRLNKEWDDEIEQQFWTEISMLYSLKHKNLASLVGFCDENDEKIIITRHHETRGSLDVYLTDLMQLTWVRRLEICVSLAHALSYIHYDEQRDFSVIHRNIASDTVLLNYNWEPMLSEFRLSKKIEASQRHESFHVDKVWDREGYTDPTYLETKSVNHKSDMYSFGIVMFELLCCRKAVIEDDQDNKYLASVVVAHYSEKKLNEIINWDLWNQIDCQSFNLFAEIAYDCLSEERSERPNIDKIVTRLEEALKLQLEHHNAIISLLRDDLGHLKIPLESILSTNYFSYHNWIYSTIYDTYEEYRGKLSWYGDMIDIYARKLKALEWEGVFWMEVSLLSSLKHKNLVSLVGFCDENDEKIIITRHETGGCLDRYLSDSMTLSWVRRLEISVCIAQVLSYIHYDDSRDFSVIHRNISSKAVILNDDWEPKLSKFQHSMKIKASERHHSFHTELVCSMDGYTDPTYEKTKSVNHKSDIYSFGMVLFELLCGRESVKSYDQDNKYLAPVAIFHYREKILDDIIDPKLRKQMEPRSLNIFAETAYECLSEEQSQRPNMDNIATRLDEALKLQLECKNAAHSSVVDEAGGTSSSHEEGSVSVGNESQVSKQTKSFLKDLSHLQLSFEDFDEKSFLNKDKTIFKGRLSHSEQFIDIFGKCYDPDKGENKMLWMELRMLSSLKHKNLVSLIGFSVKVEEEEFVEEEVNAIIYKKEENGSLEKFLTDQTLTWMQRLRICVGVANALSYIHYDAGRDFSVIHCNIRSSKILLDNEWEPKLSGFKLSLKSTVARTHRLHLTHNIIQNVYLDPKYKKTGGVTHKSDVYSLGVVLFEVLCARSAVLPDEELGEGLLSQYKSHLDDMIDPHLRKQMDPESLKIFLQTASDCLQLERAKRPHIDQVVKRLEKALKHQEERENPVVPTSSSRLKVSKAFTSWHAFGHIMESR